MMNILQDYGTPITWSIGSLFAHDAYVHKLIDVCSEIKINVPIKYAYGSIPCALQGGRVAPRNATLPNALRILDEYNSRNIGCRLTFSKIQVSQDDLSDKLSNQLMSHLNDNLDAHNGVLVTSDLLANHIHEKYPNLEVISSLVKPSVEITLGKDDVEYYTQLLDTYDSIIVNPAKISDISFLRALPSDRTEFIANHHCLPNCPMTKDHCELIDEINLKALNDEDITEQLEKLQAIRSSCASTRNKYPIAGTSFTSDDIQLLARMGFKQFNLEGRDNSGHCFIRDLGGYLFIPGVYSRLAQALMGEEV